MKKLHILSAMALVCVSVSGFAQKAGSITLEAGITRLAPQVTSGDLSPPAFPGTKTDVSSDTALTGGATYMLTDNIALNVPLGIGFEHKLTGAGRAQGFGVLGTVKALPITGLAQYRFGSPEARIRPYVGGGLTYAVFYKETGSAAMSALITTAGGPTTFTVKDKLVPTVQLGAVFNLSEKWFINAHYAKTFLKTRATFSNGQTQDIKLDPDAFSVALGYKF